MTPTANDKATLEQSHQFAPPLGRFLIVAVIALAGVIAFVPVWWTHYFVLLLPAVTCLGITVWRPQQQNRRLPDAEILQACWLIGLVLLAWPAFRWVGGNAWLALAVMAWAVAYGDHLARPTDRNRNEATGAAAFGETALHSIPWGGVGVEAGEAKIVQNRVPSPKD